MHLNDRARRWLPWLLLAVAAIATAAVYWPGVTGGWVFDDYPNIVDNSAIHIMPGHSTLAAWVNAALSSPASFLHRPLASITFALNWMMGGGDPISFKITNIVIHLANGVLLFCMLKALLRLAGLRGGMSLLARKGTLPVPRIDPLPLEGDGALPPSERTAERSERTRSAIARDSLSPMHESAATRLALIVSAAWMLLPINLMAVLYVVQRMESLCQIFVLAGLCAYLHGRWMMLTAGDVHRDRQGFSLAVAGIVIGTLLGLTSKETAVLLPAFAFLVECILLRFARNRSLAIASHPNLRGEAETPTDRRIWATFVITLFVPAVLGFAWLLRGVLRPGTLAGRDFTLVQRLMTEPRVLVDYLHWTLLPNPMVLSLYHDEIVKSTRLLTPWTTFGSILLLAALIAMAVWLRNRRPLISLGIGWFFAA